MSATQRSPERPERPERSLILMIDDEPAITDSLSYSLESAGFSAIAARSFAEASELISAHAPKIQLVILDLSLPDGHGFDWLKRLRAGALEPQDASIHPMTPVVILSSHDDEIEHIVGLEIGADDFVDKPFSPREVVARVRAVLRRSDYSSLSAHASQALSERGRSGEGTSNRTEEKRAGERESERGSHLSSQLGSHLGGERDHAQDEELEDGIIVDYRLYQVVYRRQRLGLSQQEFELFDALRMGRKRVFSRAQLINIAWGVGVAVSERTVDVHINSLRKKWAERDSCELIETVRGVGYRIADEAPLIQARGVKIS